MRAIPGFRGALLGSGAMLLGLYLFALVVRLVAAAQVPFPVFEPSAYYSGVAENLVRGEGLVSHAVWSYATPPLVVPRPAFELWLPMGSLVSAITMAVLGPSWWAAQVGGALLGALLAPLAWALGRTSALVAGLDPRRADVVAFTSGVLAAISAPLVMASVVPDSTIPFAVAMVVSALLVPRVLGCRSEANGPTPARPSVAAGLALGVSMGVAYLSRQEVIWLGAVVLAMLLWTARQRPPGNRTREAVARLWPVIAGGLVVVTPWLIRDAAEFGSAFPGQAIENMFLVRNEDIFAYADRPTAARYLGQGIATVLWNPVLAAWDALTNVLAIPTFPIGVVGLAALLGMRRSPVLRRPTALLALLAAGGMTLLSTVLLFPVASRWGTFLHASGPLLVALIVVATLGADALLARISALRHWGRPNVIIGPAALVTLVALFGLLQLGLLAGQASSARDRYMALAASLDSVASDLGEEIPATVITDHPMWVAEALDRDAIALPDEEVSSIMELSRRFAAPWVVVVDERGRYPDALRDTSVRDCLTADPVSLPGPAGPAWLFRLSDHCPGTTT